MAQSYSKLHHESAEKTPQKLGHITYNSTLFCRLGGRMKIVLLFICCLLLASCQTDHLPKTNHPTALRIHSKLSNYRRLSHKRWPTIALSHMPLKPGMPSQHLKLLRHRLILLGDLNKNTPAASKRYTPALAAGVRQFQWRHGLKADGMIGEKTLDALNVSPSKRLAQLKQSMQSWAKFPHHIGAQYIHVNVAKYELDLIKDGNNVINMKVITGKPTRPTPEIYSKVETIVLNPKWNVPRKIMRRDIIPKVLDNPNYLDQENISIYSSWKKDADKIDPNDIDWLHAANGKFPYRMSQAPGDNNALGRVKFVFLNKDDVYMHDTPQKGLFAKIQRAFSSGCVRLERPFELVEYFINDNETISQEEIVEKLNSGKTQYVQIKNAVPIYITYITAWVDKHGYSHFRENIYQHQPKKAGAA